MTISRKHQKPKPEVKASVEKIAEELDREFGISWGWDDGNKTPEVLSFSRTGISGSIELHAGEIRVHINKSFFVPLSDSFIREKVEAYLDENL